MDLTRRSFVEMMATTAVSQVARSQRAGGAGSIKRPNILFLLADDHRSDALGCMGNTTIRTPELDRLAKDGVLFTNHFCTTPICCVSRASIMLGQYAGTHGINDFATALNPEQLERSYFTQMRKAGYYTGFIGKYGVGTSMPRDSFDVWEGFPDQGKYFPDSEAGPHLTNIQTDQANEFLRSAPRDKPFCLSLSFKAPHVQDEDPRQYLPAKETMSLYENVQIPEPLPGSEDIRRFPLAVQRSEGRRRWAIRFATPELLQVSTKNYYRLVNGIDHAVGSIRRTLERLGLSENTVILYSADHGIFNGEHGLAGKWLAHEECIRVPLIIYDPRQPSSLRGKLSTSKTLHIDLQPTLLELAGLAAPDVTQGNSLLPELLGKARSAHQVSFVEHHFPFGGFIPSSDAIRTTRWKYIRYTDVAAPFEELYDLRDDPRETNNLTLDSKHAEVLHTLQRYCTTWRESFSKTASSWKAPVTEADLQRDGLT